ncbi:MAG: hypothetical protein ACOYM3_10970 [Terrimicrobiaceae bacterium]
MNNNHQFHIRVRIFSWRQALASAMLIFMTSVLFAQDGVDQQSEAYRASMAQSDVKRDAAAIRAELVGLREQMRQLMPDDVAAVDRAIQKMESLSQEQMDSVISALQEASRNKDAKGQVAKIAGALKSQGVVSTSLKQLSVDLLARETMASITSEIGELVRREVSVYQVISRLGKIHQTPKEFRDRHQERYQVANEDQKGITADLKLLSRKMETLSKDFESDPKNGLVQAATVAIAQKLPEAADSAETLTAAGPFNAAVTSQMQVIRTLVAMQQALATGAEPVERLRSLSTRLQRGAADQKEIVEAVLLIGERQDLNRAQKRLQGSLSDEVVAVRFELEPLNSLASDQLIPAQESIDKSLLNYIRMWEEHMDARVNTQEALKNILLAGQTLAAQIARTENAPKTPALLAAALEQLQREVAAAAMQQAQSARQPQPPANQQQAMQEKATDFQQRALPLSPAAAEILEEAAKQLATATPEAQAAAAQKLAEAARELAEQKAEVLALEQASEQLAKAQELTEQAEEKLENNQTAAAANDLKAAQQAAQAAQQNTAAAAPEAAQAMAQAAKALDQANQNAAQTKAQAAQAMAQAAEAALAQAQAGLAQAVAQTPGMSQMAMGAGTKAAEKELGQGSNPKSQANGGGGPSGDHLKGAGEIGKPVEVLEGLTAQDRAAVAQLQNEQPPREFIPEVQQYYKNIADGAGL